MPRYEVLPFKPDDYVEAAGVNFPWLDTRELALAIAKHPAFSGFVDGKLAGCAGIALAAWPGAGTAWAVITDVGRQYGRWTHVVVVRRLQALIREHDLVRVEALVLAGLESNERWVEHLGMQAEGLMRKAAPGGRDFVRYAWVRE